MSFATVAILLLGIAAPAAASSAEARRQVLSRFLQAPLGFEASEPQAGADYPFFARPPGGTLLLTRRGGWLLWHNDAAPANPGLARGQLRMPQMRLLGSNPAPRTTLLDRLPGRTNYLIGRAPERWRKDVAQHGRVEYREVYRQIDLVYYGNHRQLEYDFIVHPGGDPRRIRLGFEGVESLAVEPDGSLLAPAGSGQIRLHRPRAYQLDESGRRLGRFRQLAHFRRFLRFYSGPPRPLGVGDPPAGRFRHVAAPRETWPAPEPRPAASDRA